MKFVGITCILLGAMPLSFGASQEIRDIQRDVAQLQDSVRTLQKTIDQLTVLVQQTLDVQHRSDNSIAVMEHSLGETTKRVSDSVGVPLMGVSTKMEAMSEDFRNLRETVNDVGARVGKLDAKMTDLQNLIATINRPAPPPPAATGTPDQTQGTTTGPPQTTTGGSATPPPGMQAETLYSNAYRDYVGGNYDLALQEFSDYVKYFPQTQWAPNSQFYIGNIYYKKQDYANALVAFDAVLEHFSENPKTPAAHYWKGKTLLAMGKRDAAAKEFKDVVNKYSTSDVAQPARTELRNLGLSAGTGAAKSRSKHR